VCVCVCVCMCKCVCEPEWPTCGVQKEATAFVLIFGGGITVSNPCLQPYELLIR